MPKRLECAIIGCTAHLETGFRTCSLREHRTIEENYYQQGKSIFQLRARLKRAMDGHDGDTEMIELPQEPTADQPLCNGKDESGNGRVKAAFSKRRTHNEQLAYNPHTLL